MGIRQAVLRDQTQQQVLHKDHVFPRAMASLWEKQTDLMARSMNRSKVAEIEESSASCPGENRV